MKYLIGLFLFIVFVWLFFCLPSCSREYVRPQGSSAETQEIYRQSFHINDPHWKSRGRRAWDKEHAKEIADTPEINQLR